ncbi:MULTISPECIES: DUF4145 domain-containing protein [Xanthomonas]|uniref:DUF4145 domain-containing protein n=1 Tax=Xanthomonas TaxID=338 RepID=UPI001ADA67D0|nr:MULTISPECIES: DUF4145 domain-containing protein [unclassified Xanthomonas]MBO9875086.1 DUF4145 domain-containing protein [Xanthomonas sp. D-93]WNH45816.1 DUF4145 domain-containing protein [Xanthomonas sp. A6251]
MSGFNWQCPHCNHYVTITSDRFEIINNYLEIDNALGNIGCQVRFHVCPNSSCRQPTFDLRFNQWAYSHPGIRERKFGKLLRSWRLYPEGAAKPFPDYIPEAIRNDYREACLIVDLSPKASATLSRRCLQGILRDFWKVKSGTLWHEIQQVEDKTDAVTWAAINAVREIGNIGAHMEKDINVIVDVDSGEAEMLIKLVETLLTEWYIARHDREQRMKAITSAAAAKKAPPITPTDNAKE